MPSAHLPDPRKTALRRTLRAARREHAPAADRATEGAAIARAVLALLEVTPPPVTAPASGVVAGDRRRRRRRSPATTEGGGGGAWCVAAYESLPTEPPTEGLIAALLDLGVRVLVPVLEADLDLDWRPAEHPEHRTGASAPPRAGAAQLRTGSELGHDAIGTAQVVVVPALAVDRGGVRLGQGGGSYDRALARRSPGALVVAVVHDEELVDGPLPHDPHDQPVDAVVTPGLGLVRLPTIPR